MWARTHEAFGLHLFGAKSSYYTQLRANRLWARAERLEGRDPGDPIAKTTDFIRRVFERA